MNQINDPVQVVVDEIELLQRELAAAHEEIAGLRNTIQNLAERLTAALEAKHAAETEAQRAKEFVHVFREEMEKLAAENDELPPSIEHGRTMWWLGAVCGFMLATTLSGIAYAILEGFR